MSELEYLSELVNMLSQLVYLFRVSLILLGCLCGFFTFFMVFCFVKYRDIL